MPIAMDEELESFQHQQFQLIYIMFPSLVEDQVDSDHS
jgi:hypothetical protein